MGKHFLNRDYSKKKYEVQCEHGQGTNYKRAHSRKDCGIFIILKNYQAFCQHNLLIQTYPLIVM